MKYVFSTLFLLLGFTSIAQIESAPPPPPPPPPPPIESPEVFKVVEEMPRFPGCEEIVDNKRKRSDCANETMNAYIFSNLKYPTEAKTKKIEGMAVVQFQVKKDGTLDDIKTVRDPGHGLGAAASAVIKKMNTDGIKWIPGKQRGRRVIVQYTLPIRFKL